MLQANSLFRILSMATPFAFHAVNLENGSAGICGRADFRLYEQFNFITIQPQCQ
jgi:hypothetical protein